MLVICLYITSLVYFLAWLIFLGLLFFKKIHLFIMDALWYCGKNVNGNSNTQDQVLYLPLINSETINKLSQILLAMFCPLQNEDLD